MPIDNHEKSGMALEFYKDESIDYEVYRRLAKSEKDKTLKVHLERIAKMEHRHKNLWRGMAGGEFRVQELGVLAQLKILAYILARKFIGVAFVASLLGRNEIVALERYAKATHELKLSAKERRQLSSIIRDEKFHEKDLRQELREYRGQLNYIRSIILGLNDGLVELLGAVSGLAVIASTSIVVVIGGIIIGTAGTLSMAAGVYLSSKSHGLLEDKEESHHEPSPAREGIYTGIYYIIGVIIAILPFLFGMLGYSGVIASTILVCLTLTIASIIIAVVSGTSVKKRVFEMLALSLAVVAVTVALGTIARHFGISI